MIKIGTILEPQSTAQATIIWLHGLGAGSDDMASLAQELPGSLSLRHVLVDAPIRPVTINNRYHMPAWYDILGDKINDREDEEGIIHSEQGIQQVIEQQIKNGVEPRQIYLAGFSQGGAMALHTGLRFSEPLGGIICLSAYMPLIKTENKQIQEHNKLTPIFFAAGQYDQIVRHEWAVASKNFLENAGCTKLTFKTYPMEHNVCPDELRDLQVWLEQQL